MERNEEAGANGRGGNGMGRVRKRYRRSRESRDRSGCARRGGDGWRAKGRLNVASAKGLHSLDLGSVLASICARQPGSGSMACSGWIAPETVGRGGLWRWWAKGGTVRSVPARAVGAQRKGIGLAAAEQAGTGGQNGRPLKKTEAPSKS